MFLLKKFTTKLKKELFEMTWKVILCTFLSYLAIAYVGLTLLGEEALVASAHEFLYFMAVTGSTVGYGDLSPVTPAGKLFVAVFVIFPGVSLFAALLTRVALGLSRTVLKKAHGKHRIMTANHMVIVGHNTHTEKLVRQLRAETSENQRIALCVDTRSPDRNPLVELGVDYFRADSLQDERLYQNACIDTAKTVIVDIEDDNETSVVCMYLASVVGPQCTITAYVKNDMVGQVLEVHCPSINVIPTMQQNMLIKAATDPGSEEIVRKLINSGHGQTQYSMTIPDGVADIEAGVLANKLRQYCGATLIGLRRPTEELPRLNPDYQERIPSDSSIYYIAPNRLTSQEILACLAH